MKSISAKSINSFFRAYAAASIAGDAKAIGASYGPTYIEAAPSFVEAFTVDADYEDAVKAKAAAFAEMGLTDISVRVTDISPIAPSHASISVEWTMHFEPSGKTAKEATFVISYIVRDDGDHLRILISISHEDEMTLLRRLGLS